MGIFCTRWLALYQNQKGANCAKIIVDSGMAFPFGVEPEQVDPDCYRITAIVQLPDDYVPEVVVMKDVEIVVAEPEDG